MSPRPPAPPSNDRKPPVDEFDWPPTTDDLVVYDLSAEPWRGLQQAATDAFAARHGEVPRRREEMRLAAQRMAGVLTAAAIVAAAAGAVIYRAATRPPVSVEAGYRAPAAAPAVAAPTKAPVEAARPPKITIIATYPVDPVDAAHGIAPPAVEAPAPSPDTAPSSRPQDALEALDAPAVPAAGVSPIAELALSTLPAPAPVAAPAPLAAAAYTPASGIRSVLQRYEEAYDQRDVRTAATLWPSLDQRALTRAFASLDRQDVNFDRCDIDASEERGSAVCVGTVRYVPRVGRSVEKEGRITWTFDLARSGEDWRITKLSAR